MLNLIPAWPPSAERKQEDATVNLMHLFTQSERLTKLVVTDYRPTLRYFLAANQLLEMSWISVFDTIQRVDFTTGLPMAIEDLVMPDGVDLMYIVDRAFMYRQEQYAGIVNMAKPGFVDSVTWANPDGTTIEQYDDRGFLSSTSTLDNDEVVTSQIWWTPSGEPALIFDGSGYHWLLAPQNLPQDYPSLPELIAQVLQLLTEPDDHFIFRLVEDNQKLATLVTHHWSTTLHIAAQNELPLVETNDLIASSQALVLPTQQMRNQLVRRFPSADASQWHVIAPFATDLSLGASNEATNLTVYWHLNDLTEGRTEAVYLKFLKAMATHIDYAMVIDAHNDEEVDAMQKQALYSITQHYGISGDSPEFAMIELTLADKPVDPANQDVSDMSMLEQQQVAERDRIITAVKNFMQRLTFRVHSDFAEIRHDFNEARVLMDLGHQPDLFMQIRAISVGIPQVNEVETGYITQNENGTVAVSDSAAVLAVRSYLDQLSLWGKSLVVNTGLIEHHTENRLLAQWEAIV